MYRLEIIERLNSDNEESIIFSKVIPVPKAPVYVYTEDTMCSYIRSLDIPWHAKDAYICKIWFPLHRWFPKNFYRFVEVEDETQKLSGEIVRNLSHTFNIAKTGRCKN